MFKGKKRMLGFLNEERQKYPVYILIEFLGGIGNGELNSLKKNWF